MLSKATNTTLAILLLAVPAWGWTGLVTRVSDGDTIRVERPDGTEARVRLYGIDTPETAQPFGPEATAALAAMVDGKQVRIEEKDVDRYGRIVAVVFLDEVNINHFLIKSGLAWVWPRYCRAEFCISWAASQTDTRLSGKGLWSDSDPVPPWDWRRNSR